MKYTTEIIINKSIDRVIELLDNPDNLYKWMEGLQSFELLSGTQGQPGAKSLLTFKMGKREMEITETIIARNLPDEYSGVYEAQGVYSTVKQKFERISDTKTRLITESEFEFKGAMKIIAWLMPGAFKRQTKKYDKDFKNFVEAQP